jgi:asparagine synthase (glutamine-hydrolysing)
VVDGWFNSSLTGHLPQLLLDEGSLMFEILKPEGVRVLFEDHRSGREDNHKLLFSLVMFEQWFRGIGSNRVAARSRALAQSVM